MMRNNLFRMLLVPLWLFLPIWQGMFAQDNISPYSVEDTIAIGVDIFAEGDPISLTLIYDVKNFLRNKFKDEYVDARLIYHFNDTIDIEKNIRIKARGKNRKETCAFPPIWINIKNADIRNWQLEDSKKIKMVTHCANSPANLDYVLKEYLLYKMYNLFSPYSFRVHLVKVKYVDTGRKNKEYDTWGFFIEPEDLLAERLELFPLEMDNLGLDQVDPEVTDIMVIFQYMIGNADYSVTGRQNLKIFKLNDAPKMLPVPVPYDFDYSGFVDAHYAIPGPNLGITSVTQRYYLGPCRSEDAFRQIISLFFEKKDEIYLLIESFEYLDERVKIRAIGYLDEFFSNALSSRYIRNNILNTCRD